MRTNTNTEKERFKKIITQCGEAMQLLLSLTQLDHFYGIFAEDECGGIEKMFNAVQARKEFIERIDTEIFEYESE